jgi:hypothetical protein
VRGRCHAPAIFYSWERPSTHFTRLGRAPGPVLTGAESLTPTGIRSLDHPVTILTELPDTVLYTVTIIEVYVMKSSVLPAELQVHACILHCTTILFVVCRVLILCPLICWQRKASLLSGEQSDATWSVSHWLVVVLP